jgi:HEAT repeat protein
MDPIKKIVELLDDESPRKRIAAAVVIGELGVKDPQVVSRLVAMAKDPLEAYAEAGIEALGAIKSMKALPVFMDALGRGKELSRLARGAIAALGEEALGEIRARLADASPEVRAQLSQLLPAVGGRQSFEMALEGMRGQPFDAINKVALSVRAEAKESTEATRRVMKTQVLNFLGKKKTEEDEPALRGAIKTLGFLELPETVDTLLGYLNQKHLPLVRVEAAMALRFAMAHQPSKKAMRKLMELLEDEDALVSRAAKDTLTVLHVGEDFFDELAELAQGKDADLGLFAIARLAELAKKKPKDAVAVLALVARGGDRARAEAAARVLASLPSGLAHLVDALVDAEEEVGAQVLSEVLTPQAAELAKKDVARLVKAAEKQLGSQLAVAKRILEPVKRVDPEGWAELLRAKAKSLAKKDEARADVISQMLVRSADATTDDRYAFAMQQLERHGHDLHPRARQGDPALAELEKLHREGFEVGEKLLKDKKVSDDARFYVGFHFAEKPLFQQKNLGATLLEAIAGKGKGKLAKAAKNKLKLLEL